MELKLITIYKNVDQKWLDWWIKYCAPNYGLINQGSLPWNITSKDPSSEVEATTTIELIK